MFSRWLPKVSDAKLPQVKIGIVGSGALGSYYGAMLCRDFHDVHFLLRSDYEAVRRNGVRILSPNGDFNARPKCARRPVDIGPCDLVIIGLKTTANSEFPTLLPPLVAKHTAVLTLQNGLGNEHALTELLPLEQVMGGLCFVSLNRIEPGVVRHFADGKIVLGEYRRWPEPRTHDIAAAFRHSGVPCVVSDDIERTHWQKLTWNIPFNGLGVAAVAGIDAIEQGKIDPVAALGTTMPSDALLADSRWAAKVRSLMAETIAISNALNHSIDLRYAEEEVQRTAGMGAYRASTLIDFDMRRPLELESLFLYPQAEARRAKVATPHLDALCSVLTALADKLGIPWRVPKRLLIERAGDPRPV